MMNYEFGSPVIIQEKRMDVEVMLKPFARAFITAPLNKRSHFDNYV